MALLFIKLIGPLFVFTFMRVTFGLVHHHSRHCSHVHPKHDEVIHQTHIEPAHVMKKRSLDQQLRIKLFYDESMYKLDPEKFELINKTVLPEAVHYWEKALMVRKTENVIRLSRKCEDNQIFIKREDPHPYCKNSCEAITMCGEAMVPEEHLESCRVCNAQGTECREEGSVAGSGIKDADFVFYVSAMDTERCHRGQTVAYAAHCQQEVSLDRPIAGHANLCPNSISTKPQELEILISTVKHEILHALGFSVSLYAFYRDSEGNPLSPRGENGKPELNHALQARQWSDRVIKKIVRPDWLVRSGRVAREVQMVVTPRVVEEARKHFGCDTVEGAELEDQGEEGTSLTHWEKRVFENEAMTGTHTQNPIYSRITLALMEDTGWYKANMSMAQDLSWGQNLGCDFAQKSCLEWMETRTQRSESTHPFCNRVKRDPLETDCTDDRNSVALCNLVEYTSVLPPIYQNFEHIPHVSDRNVGYYGGSVSLADYCPYIQEFTWRSDNVAVRGSQCLFSENNPATEKNFALEKYGNQSRCFNHAGQWEERACRQSRQWQHWGSGCYEFSCKQGRLGVVVENRTYTCYHAGQELSIRRLSSEWLHVGGIICPPCEEICGDIFNLRGERCKADREPTEREKVSYHYDQLVCAASSTSLSVFSVIFVLLSVLKYS